MDVNKITNRTILRILALIAGWVGLIVVLYHLRTVLVWVGVSLFLALAINPLVERVEKHVPRKKRGLAVGLVFVLLLAGLATMITVLVPPLASQTRSLISDLPNLVQQLQGSDSIFGNLADRFDLVERVQANQTRIAGQVSQASVGIAQSIFSGILATLTILVLTFFMSLEGPGWLNSFWKTQPAGKRAHRQDLAKRCYKVISNYVTGRLLMAFIAAVASAIALSILRVPYAIPLGILVGLFDLVPLVGATLGAVAVVAVSLFKSPEAAGAMAIFFLVYQQLENHVLQPVIDSRTVQMSPLTVLVSAIIGVSLLGLLGALIAIPAVGCSQILLMDLYNQRHPKS